MLYVQSVSGSRSEDKLSSALGVSFDLIMTIQKRFKDYIFTI